MEIKQVMKLAQETVYSKRGACKKGNWRGVRVIKYPTDLVLYAEIIQDQKPELIIETGTRYGGSALFLADMCKLEGQGHVVSVEIEESYEVQKHPNLTCFKGSSIDPVIIEKMRHRDFGTALVILDSDHSPEHVYKELLAYEGFVHIGGYMIVEDMYQQGAEKSVQKFLEKVPGKFVIDHKIEKYGIHAGTGGFLKRIA